MSEKKPDPQSPLKQPTRKVSCKRSFDHPVLLSEPNLGRLIKYLQGKYQSVALEAVCNDGTTYQFEDADEFLAYENPDFRRVLEVNISARLYPEENVDSYRSPNKCSVNFGKVDLVVHAKVSGLRNVSFVFVDGEDERVTAIFDEVSRYIENFKPDYAPVYAWALSLGRRALFSVCIIVLAIIGQALLYRLVPIGKMLGTAGSFTLSGCLGVFVSHWSATFYTRHADRFLSDIPPVLVALGDQSKRPAQAVAMQNSLNSWTYGLLASVVISIGCSLAANFLWEQAPKP